MPTVPGIQLNYHFQHYFMTIIPVHEAFAVSAMRETRSHTPMDMARYTGRMTKTHLLSYGNWGVRCSEKAAFLFGMLIAIVFHFCLMSLRSQIKRNNVFRWNSLGYFSWHVLYYLKSFRQIPSYLPSLSHESLHLSVSSAPQIFLLLFLYPFRLFWPHLWSASQVFLVSINLGKLMSSAYFLFLSPPPALPTRTPVAVSCLRHIASQLLLYTLVGNFYPWPNFTHVPVQFSEEHF